MLETTFHIATLLTQDDADAVMFELLVDDNYLGRLTTTMLAG